MTCRVFVEGVDDIRFLQHLLKVLVPTFPDWEKLTTPGPNEIKETFVDVGEHTLVLTATQGWSKTDSLGPYARTFAHPRQQMSVDRTLILFDADAPRTNNHQPCADGGFQARLAALKAKTAKFAPKPSFFLYPDNASDGTLETLLEGMVAADKRPILTECWEHFCACTQRHGATYLPTPKAKLHQYAALFDKDAMSKDYFCSSLDNPALWDWTSPVLAPLVDFLRRELPIF